LLENMIPCVDEAQALCPNEVDPDEAMYCLSGALQIEPSAFSDQCKALVQNFIACGALSSATSSSSSPSSDSYSYSVQSMNQLPLAAVSDTAPMRAMSLRADGPWTTLKQMGAEGRKLELARRRAGSAGPKSVSASIPGLGPASVVSSHWSDVLEARRFMRRLQGQQPNITCIYFDETDESESGSSAGGFGNNGEVYYYYYSAYDDYSRYDDGGDDNAPADDDTSYEKSKKNKNKNKNKNKGNKNGKGGEKQDGKTKQRHEKKKAKHNDDTDDDTSDTYFGGFHAAGLFFGGVLFILLMCLGFMRLVIGPYWNFGDTRSAPIAVAGAGAGAGAGARVANTNFGRRGWDTRGTYVRAPLQDDEDWERGGGDGDGDQVELTPAAATAPAAGETADHTGTHTTEMIRQSDVAGSGLAATASTGTDGKNDNAATDSAREDRQDEEDASIAKPHEVV
jgi:hypothetical protein